MKNPRTRPSTLDNPIIDMMPRIVMWWPSRPPAPIGYSRPPGIVPIPGTRKLERLEENLGAVDLAARSLHRHSIVQADDQILEMNNGCMCCTFRSDLIRIIGDLMQWRGKFDHLLIETTGLADLGPVIQSFFTNGLVRARTQLDPAGWSFWQ